MHVDENPYNYKNLLFPESVSQTLGLDAVMFLEILEALGSQFLAISS